MKIVVVGGGAGGLELATKLGRKLGKGQSTDVVLVDTNQMHLWKPLLHEVATGTLDSEVNAVSYRAHAYNNAFEFKLGSLCGIDREKKCIFLKALSDSDGEQILPERTIYYDKLVLAIGSVSNDFGTPGIQQHCTFLDSASQAKKFQKKLIHHFIRIDQQLETNSKICLNIAIVGGGATGVELSAELFNARHWFSLYGLTNVTKTHLKVTLVEAGPRLLPALSDRISAGVRQQLEKLGVTILLNTKVATAEKNKLLTADGTEINADLMVWAAGVKAPDFLKNFGGLETNRQNQILVNSYLQSTQDSDIYAIGDCASCPLDATHSVPPRAQSAHQMASCIYENMLRINKGKATRPFKYVDHGSLVSLSRYATIGTLMGNLGASSSWNVEGKLARLAYLSLYRMHQAAVHGVFKMMLMTIVGKVNHVIRPRLKLH